MNRPFLASCALWRPSTRRTIIGVAPGSCRLLSMKEVTRILSGIEQGDPHASEELLTLVYDELRKLAAQKLARERPGQTLQPTALVHEAYIRLVAPAKSFGTEEAEK